MNYAFRHRRPDDADEQVFFGFLDTWSTETELTVGGRVLEVEITVDLIGTYDGRDLLPNGPVAVVGKNGGCRLVNPPMCPVDPARLKLTGFTKLLTIAVNDYLMGRWDDIEQWAREQVQ